MEREDNSLFYENLQKICKERGTTPTTVTVALGIGKGTMSQWKNGSSPTGRIIIRFADYLGVTTDYLLKGEEGVRKMTGNRLFVNHLFFYDGLRAWYTELALKFKINLDEWDDFKLKSNHELRLKQACDKFGWHIDRHKKFIDFVTLSRDNIDDSYENSFPLSSFPTCSELYEMLGLVPCEDERAENLLNALKKEHKTKKIASEESQIKKNLAG
jgi:transcriptional regulator with XRE-family HTH domain